MEADFGDPLRDAGGSHAVDGVAPRFAASPQSYADVAEVLALADASGLAVIPLGGRTHDRLGNLPTRYDVALDLTGLDGVVEFEPADLTVTVQAGMTLGRLRKLVSAAGLMVPFDPEIGDGATVGGVLAADVAGSSAAALGTARDFTIGMRVVMADGRVTRAGGRVVKNVAGYDLCKLYIGSLGTLGVIVEATFKTVPLPKRSESVSLGFGSAAEACVAANRFYAAGLTVQSARVRRGVAGWELHLGLAGMPKAVERSLQEVRGAGAPGITPSAAPEPACVARTRTLPSLVPALLESLASELPQAAVEAHPITGLVRVGVSEASALTRVREMEPSCVVERCPAATKAGLDVFGEAPSSLPLMRAVKERFDPRGTLSPGRFVGRI